VPSAWRLTKTRYLPSAWDGEGGRKTGGRWNSVGVPVVYVSATVSLALVETLVHMTSGLLPAYSVIPCFFDDSLVSALDLDDLPSDWRSNPAPTSTRRLGDEWVERSETAVLRVPSVAVPFDHNYVLNPRHRHFARIRIGTAIPFPFDPRLFSKP
jgi:RES domain-containing protein